MAEPHDDGVRAAYREPRNDRDELRAQPDNELCYFPESDRHSAPIGAVYGLLLPVLAAVVATTILRSPAIGALVGAALLGWALWRRRRVQVLPRATLRVEDGHLELNGPAFGQPVLVDLKDLLDVYLDTKPMPRVSRIALELRSETFYLTQERGSHLDANDWFDKIRRFLRRHGWVPEDERPV